MPGPPHLSLRVPAIPSVSLWGSFQERLPISLLKRVLLVSTRFLNYTVKTLFDLSFCLHVCLSVFLSLSEIVS